jgi:predicted ATPase/class 3 adenylate cyclase
MDTGLVTFLFTDIEASTRLWEVDRAGMSLALARHDELASAVVGAHNGTMVKRTGDGMHAVFADPLDALHAAVALQRELSADTSAQAVGLHLRCGVHVGVAERRDGDWFGSSVNRAARIMTAASGGQILASHVVKELVQDRLPSPMSLLDLGTVRLRGLVQPERIYQVVHPDLRRDFPAVRSLEAPNNLPVQLTSFIGRERELEESRDLLRRTRLLTLTGPGGIGKTRLALELAAVALDDFEDGAWSVELAAISDPELVAQAVASVLGVKEQAGAAMSETLAALVADRRMLLLLDNCEHLIEACATLASRLLRASDDLKIMVTSREPLRVSGERVFPVPALALPVPGAPMDGAKCAAVTLFVDRAAAHEPAFALTPRNAGAIADVCRRLDGIPLAIELAAARVRSLPVEQIAARLNDRFRLLVHGDRTALPRQQTLQALIDWSYELLSSAERALLRRLSVFAGGWSLEAAEEVGAGPELARDDVLEVLGRLVEKSLVVASAETSRYTLLETVRQYAQSRLDAADEARTTRGRHVTHYLHLAQAARAELIGPTQATALARLDVERENLLAAHGYCDDVESGAEHGLMLVSALRRYWIFGGLLGMGHRLTLEALARPGAQGRTEAREQALFDAGQIDSWMGRYAEARRYLDESLSIARERGDEDMVARILQPIGLSCMDVESSLPRAPISRKPLRCASGSGTSASWRRR